MSLSAVPQRCVPRTERRAGAAGIPRTGRVRVLQMEPPPCSKAPSLPALPVLCPRSLARGYPGLPPAPWPLRAAAPGPRRPCLPAGRSGQGAGGAGERQLPLAGACPDLLRIPGIAAGLAAGLGVQVAAHTDTHMKIHKSSSQTLRGPSHLPG